MANLDELRKHIADELIPDRHERGKYQCPICGSGSGGYSSDGAFSIDRDGVHGKCFACGFYGDIFDLVAARDGVTTKEAAAYVIRKYAPQESFKPVPKTEAAPPPFKVEPEKRPDFSEYIKKCHDALKGSEGERYLRERGISDDTMERFKLGYDTDILGQPCIVIPYNPQGTYYSTRAINKDATRKHNKPKGAEAGREPIFNAAALAQNRPCFVVESQLCAISIMQGGVNAVAIGGTSGISKLLYSTTKPNALLILSLDNDEAGREAQAKLAEGLRSKGIPFAEVNVAGDCKDPNELLQKDPQALYRGVQMAVVDVEANVTAQQDHEREEYEAKTTSAAFSDFERYLKENASRPPIPTGFSELDKILNGGLTAGLYIMGAISSLGKTSWMLNIADNISAAGRDVLYFSLEMSRNELMAKSISRLSLRCASERKLDPSNALSTFGVLNSKGSASTNPVLPEAMQRYRDGAGKHMWIFEGVGNFGVDAVTQQVENHIRLTGRNPVVFIDYLQILAPADPRATDKQNTDKAVTELKRLSAAHDIPIFCISSLNRLNYNEPITMAAFKESGAIEYGSDVLIGLQLYGIGYRPEEKQAAHVARVRDIIKRAESDPQIEIEVRVLKNRNGKRGGSGRLKFDKAYNSFIEIPDGFTAVYDDLPPIFDDDPQGGQLVL